MSYTLKLENGRRVHVSDLSEEEINKTENRYNSMVCHVCHNDEEHSVPKHSLGGFILGAGIGTILANSVLTKQYNKQKAKRTKTSSESSDKKTSTKTTPKAAVASNKKSYLPNGLIKSIDTTSKKRITNKDIVDGVNLNEKIKVPANNKYKKAAKNLSDKKITDQTNYLPKRQIASVNTTYGRNFKREDLRDGAYIKKGVKFAEGGSIRKKDENYNYIVNQIEVNEKALERAYGTERVERIQQEIQRLKDKLKNEYGVKYAEGGTTEYAKGGNVSSIEKKVNEVNRLIELANKNDISVVDSSSTWESPMKYKPIKYSNGTLYIEYEELDLYKYNRTGVSNWVTKKDKVLKRNMEFDNPLNEIAKMYRKALKSDGIEFAEGGSTDGLQVTLKEQMCLDGSTLTGVYYIQSSRKDSKGRDIYVVLDKENGQTYECMIPFSSIAAAKNKYAKGGYLDKSEEEVWNNWSVEQRRHFLKDHRILRSIPEEHRVSLYRFDELPIDLFNVIKYILKEHINEGQYAKGGSTDMSHYKVDGHIFIDYMDAVDYCDKHNLSYDKIIKSKEYALGGGIGLTESEAKNILENLKKENKITLSIGNHGLIFMQIIGANSYMKSYDSYSEALEAYNSMNKYAKGGGIDYSYYDNKSKEYLEGEIAHTERSARQFSSIGDEESAEDRRNHAEKLWEIYYAKRKSDKYAKGGGVDSLDIQILTALSGFNDGRTIQGVLETLGYSNYRFNKYASESDYKKVEKELNNLVKKGYVTESGIGYEITKAGSDYRRNKYARGGGVEKTRKAPFKVGDMVYSYQNPNDKMRISFIEDRGVIDGVDYGWGIKVALKVDENGNYNPKGTYSQSSKWMSANSVSKTKKEKYALGGGIDPDETPKIYVADLAAYNEGKLVGKWLDLTDYSDADDLMAAIQDLMSDFSEEQGVTREEWAIHDFENFPSSFYSEYMGRDEFEKIYQLMEAANDRDIPYEVLGEAMSMKGSDDPYEVADNYNGEYDSFKDFAYQLVDDIGISGVSNPDFYFDYEGFGSDERINMSSEEEEEYGYEDLSDEDLGYELVEQVGGLEGLSERTREMYFDYDKFARDLEYDYDEIRMNGMSYIFFSSYKRGGVPGR